MRICSFDESWSKVEGFVWCILSRGILDNKDNSLVFGVFKLMKCVSEDSGDELEYPRELFLGHYKLQILVVGFIFHTRDVSSIPVGGSISPEGFLSSIMLLVVIIVTVLIVAVILVVVVIVIVRVVIVVVFIGIVVVGGGVSSIFKLSFVIISVLRRIVCYYLLHQSLSYGNGFL
ncbi:hypothetical protein Tco_0974172 [Tanacetum coccineum]|uniref:Uncharacterized protein n=1 Tax=Tanacetum coccineum TaxID=301880 RepID=A0ABQ5EAU4_9ASTR